MVETVQHRSEPPIEYRPTIPGTLHLPRFSLLQGREDKRREKIKVVSGIHETHFENDAVRPSLPESRPRPFHYSTYSDQHTSCRT